MNKIQKMSSYLLMIFNFLLFSLPLFIILRWIFIETDVRIFGEIFGKTIQAPDIYINLSSISWTLPLKFLGFSADIIGLFPFILSLYILKMIFMNYEKGVIFTSENAFSYKKLGVLFFVYALLIKPLANMLLILAITFTNPVGQRCISISFGTHNFQALFFGFLIIILSWVMHEAHTIQEEQKLTI